ncbi:hypothetical protein T492DRAFT_981617, partial [Pavlovales sp. CCMP2436]
MVASGCTPCNTSVILTSLPIFYIAQAASPALEARLRLAGACGVVEHVPAIMARAAFPAGTPSPVQFTAWRQQLNGSIGGVPFSVRRWPVPRQSKETCPAPNLTEIAILLSHLRAMALAYRSIMRTATTSRPEVVLIVEEDVDLRLVPLWPVEYPNRPIPSSSLGVEVHAPAGAERPMAGLDALFGALPSGWGLAQLAVISSGGTFKMLRQKLSAGEHAVSHSDVVGKVVCIY